MFRTHVENNLDFKKPFLYPFSLFAHIPPAVLPCEYIS